MTPKLQNKTYYVYKHTTPNGKVYIGITAQNPSRRWRSGEGYKHNAHFYSAIVKYGWDAITHEILSEGLTKDQACEIEKEMILQTKSYDRECGYNQTFGGEAYEFTEDVKERMRQSHPRSWLGRHHTEGTKAKIKQANAGKVFSEEHKAKIKENHSHCKSFEGKRHTEESKRKISENHFRLYGAENPAAKKVKCIETGEIFGTLKEAAETKNASPNHISSCCHGHRKTCGGFHWEFVMPV